MINLVIMAKYLKPIGTDRHVIHGNFLKGIVAMPARRALAKENIDSLQQLSKYSEDEILQFHGFGKNTMERLKIYMQERQISFKK